MVHQEVEGGKGTLPVPWSSTFGYNICIPSLEEYNAMEKGVRECLSNCFLEYTISSQVHDQGVICQIHFGQTSSLGAKLYLEEIMRCMSTISEELGVERILLMEHKYTLFEFRDVN